MVRRWLLLSLGMLIASAAAPGSAGAWTPSERVETYPISGATGLELYRSIGEHGPKVGVGRAIAYTTFDLKWSRDYRAQPDGSCRLVSARPKLVVITRLPKPTGPLSPETGKLWDTFISGIRTHERYHAETVVDMVRAIEAYSVGLTVAGDRDCRKIRQVLTKRLGELSQEQREKGRAFDRLEMGAGGNVHRLVIALIEGG